MSLFCRTSSGFVGSQVPYPGVPQISVWEDKYPPFFFRKRNRKHISDDAYEHLASPWWKKTPIGIGQPLTTHDREG